MLRPTVSGSVRRDVGHPSEAHGQIFISVGQLLVS
jgi:hypothetical protein